jgi:peptidyl-prolyl cis-trans isomerase D
MMVPFNDFAFDKATGTKGIVKTDFGYHYLEVLGQKGKSTAYKIAYLAKAIAASNETVTAANTAAAQFAVSAKDAKQFNTNAMKENRQILSANDVRENDFAVTGLGPNRQLVHWIYQHDAGEISDPIEIGGDRYVVALITAVNKAGLMSASEARPAVESIVRNEKKARIIIDTKFKGNTLAAYASSTGAQVLRADSLAFSAPFIAGIGSEPKIVGAAFNKSLMGKASEPIAGTTGVFSIKIESTGAKASMQDLNTMRQSMIQNTRMTSYRGLDALKKSATIKDNRAKFY